MEKTRKKVAIIGDTASGKTSLLAAFSNIIWPGVYVPSNFESFDVDLKHYNVQMEFGIWGISGLQNCFLLRTLFYQNVDVVLICYSIDNTLSLDNVAKKWLPEVNRNCPDVPIILVGNNKHRRHDDMLQQSIIKYYPVDYDDGMQMSKFIGAVNYLECSARTGDGINEVFETAKQFAMKK